MRNPALPLIALFILALAPACTDEKGGDAKLEEKTTDKATGPQVSVKADKTHAVQPGDIITLTVTVTNFTLDPSKIGQANEANIGHYRVYLDKASVADSGDGSIKVNVPSDITDGSHRLHVVLHNNDRTPLTPPVEAGVWLIVYRL
ncbi:MAG: hypothetical protein ACE5NW_08630 [Acidiferrobacterales bacterium]